MKRLWLASLFLMLSVTQFAFAGELAVRQGAIQGERHHVAARANSKSQYTQPVDINQADATQLATLKGIGPKKADAIVAYRAAHGPFTSVTDLSKVKGIGAKSVARLQAKNPGRLVVNTSKKVG